MRRVVDLFSPAIGASGTVIAYGHWGRPVLVFPSEKGRLGEWVIDAHLPTPGTPTQPIEAGYWANAYVRMRHPDYDELRGMLDDVGRTVHVHAG